jgi:hypothetical protein
MEEVQRIREAMAEGRHVFSEAQQERIRPQSTLLGEDGDTVMEAIQEDAATVGRLPADVAKIIEKCCQDLYQRVARLEKSNEVEREREPERLQQIERMREQVAKYATAKEKGNMADQARVKEALPTLLSKYLKDLETDKEDGLSPDVVETWKQAALDVTGDTMCEPAMGGPGLKTGRRPGAPQKGHREESIAHRRRDQSCAGARRGGVAQPRQEIGGCGKR